MISSTLLLSLSMVASVAPATSLEGEVRLLLAREPFTQEEIRALASTDDVFALDFLEGALERRLSMREAFSDGLAPPTVDRELVEALRGIERLDPLAGVKRAREVLERTPPDSAPAFGAREVLARGGHIRVIREALSRYFEDPPKWGKLLGEAARSQDDPRLVDFLELAGAPPSPAGRRLRRSRLERNLARSRRPSTLAAIRRWAAPPAAGARRQGRAGHDLAAAPLLSRIPKGTRYDGRINRRLAALAVSPAAGPVGRATRLHALSGLGRRGAEGQAPVVGRALRVEDPLVAAVAARALGRLKSRDAEAELRKLARSSTDLVSSEAVNSLIALGGREEARRLAEELPAFGFRTAAPILEALESHGGNESAALMRVLDRMPKRKDRIRTIRLLYEKDHPVLPALSLDTETVNSLSPFLAYSRTREVRQQVLRATGPARGGALAAILASPRPTLDEKERALRTLGGAWPEAVVQGGERVIREIERLAVRDPGLAAFKDPALWSFDLDSPLGLDVLSLLPGAQARRSLERAASEAALESLMRRQDRVLSLPVLDRLSRREGADSVRLEAEKALIELSAPGALAIMQRRLSAGGGLTALAPVLSRAPLALQAFRRIAAGDGPLPDVAAALFGFYRHAPSEFTRLLSMEEPSGVRRVYSTLALSGDPVRLPVLIDLAVYGKPAGASRRGAFRALAETDLRAFAARLHRTAGDKDRRIRFETAVALVPTGEAWAARLLVAELDAEAPAELAAAGRALRRLPAESMKPLLDPMVWDGTANGFAIGLLLDLAEEEALEVDSRFRGRVWEVLSRLSDEDPLALIAASRLDWAEAAKAVGRHLDRLSGS